MIEVTQPMRELAADMCVLPELRDMATAAITAMPDRFAEGYAAAKAEGWQPIATAPRDGTCILMTSDHPSWKYPFPAFWDVAQGCWIFADWPLNDIWGVSDLVSHWRHLPAPPTMEPGA